jgi:hypothetical protein
MPTWKLVTKNGKLLKKDGAYRRYDADANPNGPPAGCCCEEREPCEFPAELTGTFSDKTGYAVNFPDTVTFTGDGMGAWQWLSGLNCGFGENNLTLNCTGDNVFVLNSGAGNISPFFPTSPDNPPAPSFNPLMLQFTISGTFGCGAMSYVLTITE